jgi:hypothetical protein
MKLSRILVASMAACTTVGLMAASTAQGQINTSCANANFIFLGERVSQFHQNNASLYFKARVTGGRSYTVIAWAPFQAAGQGGANLAVSIWGDAACSTEAIGVDPTDYEPRVNLIPDHTGEQDSIIPSADGVIYIQVANSVGIAYTTQLLVIETTLFSPWWFTGGSNQAFIEMRNNMSTETVARVTMYRPDGIACGSTAVTIPGNGNAAISVGVLCGAGSGSAQIAFAGTPGGMIANTTTIDAVNGTSFDSPFAPRMVWSTFSR